MVLKRVLLTGCLYFFFVSSGSFALTLNEAVNRALRNDPVYLGAQASLGVSQARSSQAFSTLMPQLTASVNSSRNRRDYTQGAGGGQRNVLETYNSDSAQLNLTQPLLHLDNYYAMRQADYVVAQSNQQLLSARQDLFVRLAQAWFDIMQAQDAIFLASSRRQLADYQKGQAAKAYAKGLMSKTDAELAQGKSELAEAEEEAANSQLSIRIAALEQIIGPVRAQEFPEFVKNISMPEHGDKSLEYWMKLADENSPDILAARYALNAASQDVLKQYAGNEPTLDIVASYGKSSQGAGLTGGQAGFSTKTNTVGLQLNVPIFSGGGQVAKVREANALKEKAIQDLELAVRKVHLLIKQEWFTWRSSASMLAASHRNVQSTAFALKGARAGKARGIKSTLDVLKAKSEFDGAMKDFHKAQYDVLISYFKLLAGEGHLDAKEFARIDRARKY